MVFKRLTLMKSIAVIGSGIAGLSAAWLLDDQNDVYIFEKQNRVGGHTNTVDAPLPSGHQPVDTGFIVYNETNYPNLVALFDQLNVPTEPTNMSFGVSQEHGLLEYSTRNINAVFGQRLNLFSSSFWRMILDIRRFYKEAPEILKKPKIFREKTLGQYLSENQYSHSFIDNFILTIGAAIWSTNVDIMRYYPVEAFVRFFSTHGLLQFKQDIKWRTVCGGSREYVKRLTSSLKNPIQLGNGATKIIRENNKVFVIDSEGEKRKFDALIIATHADDAIELLNDADPLEKKILEKFRYTQNRAVLHTDDTLMPKRKRIWSSWNYMGTTEIGPSVTYWMNSLQTLDTGIQIFLTINPKKEISSESIICDLNYSHPVFDLDALNAQESLWRIQGIRNCWFCGSYFGHGFHEDALQSGLAAAENLGDKRRPWRTKLESSRIHLQPESPRDAII